MSKTVLHDLHIKSKANMVDFYGWRLPMHYGSQLDEHKKVRASAGMFDVSHMNVTDISGDKAEDWLRLLLTCDVKTIKEIGQAKYCLMLNEEGGIIDDLIVYKMPAGFRIVSNCGTRERVGTWFEEHKNKHGFADVKIQQRDDLSIVAAQGPKAFAHVFQVIYTKYEGTKDFGLLHHHFEYAKQMPAFYSRVLGDIHLSRTGYTGEDGVELILPHKLAVQLWTDLLELGVQPCGLGARDTLRLEAGMSLYGQDMNEDCTPKEARLQWAVDLKDEARNFTGKAESLAREPRFKTSSFVITGRGIPRHDQEVFKRDASEPCGIVTSGTYSPSLEIGIGFCRIPTDGKGQDFEAAIRRSKHHMDLVKGSFIRKGKPAYIPIEG